MSEKLATFIQFPPRQPGYTAAEKQFWNLLQDFVSDNADTFCQHSTENVITALSDAFLMESNETSGDKSKRLLSIGRALEKVSAEEVA